MDRLLSIVLIEGDRSAADGSISIVPLPEDVPLLQQVAQAPSVRQRLGEAAVLTLDLTPGAPAAAHVEGSGLMLLRARRILRLTFASGAQHEYRILDVKRDLAGASPVRVTAESLWWSDLASIYPRRRLVTGYADPEVVLTGRTAAEAWAELLSPALGSPALYAPGTVAAPLAGVPVRLDFTGDVTVLQGLQEIAEQVRATGAGGEIEVRYDAGSDRYLIDLVQEAGWTAGEVAEGEADPDLRPIRLGAGGGARRALTRTSDGRGFFSRIVPLSRTDGGIVTAAQARHRALSHTYQASSDRTLIRLESGTTLGKWPRGFYLEHGGVLHEVVDVAGDLAYVPGSVAAAPDYRIAAQDGGEVIFIADLIDEAWTGIAELSRFFDVPPYPNLLAGAGVSADLSAWASGMPEGAVKVGAPTVTQIDGDARFVRHGTRSARVEADAGEGIETIPIALDPTTERPWQSAYVSVRVESGRVRVELEDAAGAVHPDGQRAGSNADRLEAVAIEGITAAAGEARLRVVAEEDATVFYLDAWTLTPSPSAWEFAPRMGPRALYEEGIKALREEGGVQPDRYEGATFDESHFSGALAEIRLGSHVRVQDAYNPATLSFDVDVTTRVEEIQYTIDPIDGAVMKTFTLSRLRKSFASLFNPALRRDRLWRVPNEDRTAVMLSATLLAESGDEATVRLSARALKRGPYELVQRLSTGASEVIAELGTLESTAVVPRPDAAGGWVEYEAVQLGVPMSPAVRLPLSRRPPEVSVTKTSEDTGPHRIVTYDVTLSRTPDPGLVLALYVVEGPPSTALHEGQYRTDLGFYYSQGTSLQFVFTTVLGQEITAEFVLLDGTRRERTVLA